MHIRRLQFALAAAFALSTTAGAQSLPIVDWRLETPVLAAPADADDPSLWLHPSNPSASLVVATAKNGGLRVYDLAGNTVQSLLNAPATVDGVSQASRLNNVDVQYGLRMADGTRSDVAVFTDRGQDRLRLFRITDTPGAPLQEIAMSPSNAARLFPNGVGTGQPIGMQTTGYGVTLWRDASQDRLYAIVNQRREAVVTQFELTVAGDGFHTTKVREWQFPTTFQGTALDPGSRRQFEGMVVDQQTGMLYAGQEDVGIWRVNLLTGVADAEPLWRSREFDPSSPLTSDVEGLTIRYGANGTGALIASSQGDSTFAVFDRQSFAYLGGFRVGRKDASGQLIPGTLVDNSDGADVTSFGLPGFGKGLFVVHDGANGTTGTDGTNFKYVAWEDITAAVPGLAPYTDPVPGFDPRNVALVPEPGTLSMWLAGAGLLAGVRLRRG